VATWHTPVLVEEALAWLQVKPEGAYVDVTVGTGGHAEAILRRLSTGRLIGLDKDPRALEMTRERLQTAEPKLVLRQSSMADFRDTLAALGEGPVDGVLADLGVSSLQLGSPERGFSFQQAGPLDMRMDPSAELTADYWVNHAREEELADVLHRYGEERHANKIARAIVRSRPVRDTRHLAAIVTGTWSAKGRQKLHPATRTFLALRIAVNREQEELEQFLFQVPVALKPGGRVVVLSYHSLEDRRVKQAFRRDAAEGRLRILTKKVVRPGRDEIRSNPRARSARLRAAERAHVQ
jgi:16S rRNA (cytosine1402-N4)-methyltransferase